MGRGAAFNEILEEKLGGPPIEEPRRRVTAPAGATHPHAFVFFTEVVNGNAAAHANPRCWKAPRPVRPRRTLRSHQQRAFEELSSLGAGLQPDFTNDELRSAFRRLARQYHPDTHPNSAETEKQRLSAIFGRVRDAYEHLQAA